MRYDEKIIQRFFKKVDKEKSATFFNGTRCWEWTAFRDSCGYGRIFIGENVLAHRVSYEIEFGKINNHLEVLHKCDNPSCVNPDHLFLGTQKDNILDMDFKGRRGVTQGEMNGMSKLTKESVIEIRKRYQKNVRGSSAPALGREFGVSSTLISLVIRNKIWKI